MACTGQFYPGLLVLESTTASDYCEVRTVYLSVSWQRHFKAVPCLKLLVAGHSPWNPGFDLGPVHVRFVMENVTMGQVSFQELQFYPVTIIHLWPGSVVGIATVYGLNGPGIKSRWGWDFPHLSRPALSPTQTLVQWVPDLSRELFAAEAWRWPLTPF